MENTFLFEEFSSSLDFSEVYRKEGAGHPRMVEESLVVVRGSAFSRIRMTLLSIQRFESGSENFSNDRSSKSDHMCHFFVLVCN